MALHGCTHDALVFVPSTVQSSIRAADPRKRCGGSCRGCARYTNPSVTGPKYGCDLYSGKYGSSVLVCKSGFVCFSVDTHKINTACSTT